MRLTRILCFSALALMGWAVLLAPAERKKKPPAKPLDLNTATFEELRQLPGIGPTTAKAILRFREKSGPFRRVEDLLAIRGITTRKLEKLRPYVTVTPAAPAKRR
jgi:competence protein ComEA